MLFNVWWLVFYICICLHVILHAETRYSFRCVRVCVCVCRSDRSAGRQRAHVWMGSLTADHLLQEPRELQGHQDTLQLSGQQGASESSGISRVRALRVTVVYVNRLVCVCVVVWDRGCGRSAQSLADQHLRKRSQTLSGTSTALIIPHLQHFGWKHCDF